MTRQWKTEDGLYDDDEVLYLGDYAVAAVRWHPARKIYEWSFYLDNRSQDTPMTFDSERDAKKRAEQLLDLWLHRAGLEEV